LLLYKYCIQDGERMLFMSNHVILVDDQKMKEIISYYTSSKVIRNAPGVIFAAKLADTAITAYKSGKVMFQGGGAEREAALWGKTESKATPEKVTTKGDHLPNRLAEL